MGGHVARMEERRDV